MRVSDLMISPPVTVPPDSTAAAAARLMADRAIGCVLVADSRALLGVLTDRDLVVRVLADGADADTSVARLMSTPPLERSMMIITRDTLAGRLQRPAHDTLFGRCSHKLRLRRYGNQGDSAGCQEIIASAIAPFGLAETDVHDALNLFMQTWIDENDQFAFCASEAEAGDLVELQAAMDCVVAVSACSGASSRPGATGIRVLVGDPGYAQ